MFKLIYAIQIEIADLRKRKSGVSIGLLLFSERLSIPGEKRGAYVDMYVMYKLAIVFHL